MLHDIILITQNHININSYIYYLKSIAKNYTQVKRKQKVVIEVMDTISEFLVPVHHAAVATYFVVS